MSLDIENRWIFLGVILIGLFGLLSCKEESKSNATIFRMNMAEGLETTDPAFAKSKTVIWVDHQLYNTLVKTDPQLHIIPSLAKSWEVSEDGKIFTFHLRTDVYFHDNKSFKGGNGRKMVASDVVYSFKRIMDPETASAGAWVFNGKVDPDVGFVALNDSTFQLKLLKPFHPILGILTMPYCSIVPKEVVEKYGKDFRSHPCGTGPFQLKYWNEGQVLILEKNPHYFEKDSSGHSLPYLDAVKVTFVSSKVTEFLMFVQGELDFLNDVDVSYKDELLTKSGRLQKSFRDNIIMLQEPYLNTEYLGFLVDSTNTNVIHSPVTNRKVRLAINYGFDREKIAMYLKNNIVEPAYGGFVPDGLPAYDTSEVKGYHYNSSKARKLLAAAGYPDGQGLPPITLYSTQEHADVANLVAAQLRQIGVVINVTIEQAGMLRDMAAKSQIPFFRADWIADYPDAESFLACFYSKNPAPPNYSRFSNATFDRLYERAITENNDSIRHHLYHKMEHIVLDYAPVVPLYYDESVMFIHPWVKGVENNALGLLVLENIRINKSK
ncbi:MAG TPA: ABC transporter substrate-binding protein [Chitinophagaceae bacterium]|nr:ABC transporter substrate-binding protein [Chitinophagaceae bacterium]